MREIERETRSVEKVRAQVARENRAATAKADEARAIQQECEADLAAAMPQLRAAEHAVNSLRRQDITEVRTMTSPPDGVRLVMQAVCIMFKKPPQRVPDPLPHDPAHVKLDYWQSAQKNLLADARFI